MVYFFKGHIEEAAALRPRSDLHLAHKKRNIESTACALDAAFECCECCECILCRLGPTCFCVEKPCYLLLARPNGKLSEAAEPGLSGITVRLIRPQ